MKKRIYTSLVLMIADAIVIFSFLILSFICSLDLLIIKDYYKPLLCFSAILSLLSVLVLFVFKIYKIQLKTFGIIDSFKIFVCVCPLFLTSFIILLFIPCLGLPSWRFISYIFCFISILFVLTLIRVIPRVSFAVKNHFQNKNRQRTLIVGGGAAAKIIIDDSRKNKKLNSKIVLILDDDPLKIGTIISNIPVKGPISQVSNFIKDFNIEQVIISIAALSVNRLHEIIGYLSESNVRVKRMPLLSEMNGPYDKTIIDVDIDDILSRKTVLLNNSEIDNMLHQKVVLVTGAGGSIGSELVKQIYKTHPKTLILFDIYENSTYEIQQELLRRSKNEGNTTGIVTLIGSTYNEKRVDEIIEKYKPNFIFHAAAYKHVPLMEDSPAEAIRTNVIGTYNVAKSADKYGVEKMILVSTDKAVRPTNTMGATKRFAETIIQYFSEKSKKTAYAAVRFGNVLGSNGSVVPLFKKQIELGGPITLTHKDIIRYFMTIPEAVSLILQCALYANGGEIFILDMGKPVKIYDLAVKLIKQAGLVPEKDIKIIETGLRPGEKLYEELLIDSKTQKRTQNERIFVEEKKPIQPIEEEILKISKVFELKDNLEIKKLLKSIITTYTITENKE